MSKRYPPQFFLDLFSPIPAKKWRTTASGKPGGPRCAIGHIRAFTGHEDDVKRYSAKNMRMISALGTIIAKTLPSAPFLDSDSRSPGFSPIIEVNDHKNVVKGKGPRDRVLNVLKAAIKKGIV